MRVLQRPSALFSPRTAEARSTPNLVVILAFLAFLALSMTLVFCEVCGLVKGCGSRVVARRPLRRSFAVIW